MWGEGQSNNRLSWLLTLAGAFSPFLCFNLTTEALDSVGESSIR